MRLAVYQSGQIAEASGVGIAVLGGGKYIEPVSGFYFFALGPYFGRAGGCCFSWGYRSLLRQKRGPHGFPDTALVMAMVVMMTYAAAS